MRRTAMIAAAVLGMSIPGGSEGFAEEIAAAGGATHEVIFGFDRTPFGAEGIETVAVAAREFRMTGAGAADVAGHADTVGDAEYNRALGLRRARFTRDELIARGVPASAIAVTTFGETDLAEATGDGVRRAANRRVTVANMAAGTNPLPDETRPYRFTLPNSAAIKD